MYLETSSDVLNLSLAVSVFGLAFLLGWILIYFILIVRRLVRLLEGMEKSLSKLENFVSAAKEKLEHSASYLSVLALGTKELVKYFIEQRQGSRAKGKKT